MKKLADIRDGVIANIIAVDPSDIPDFCTDWPDATHLKMGQTYDADAVAALVLEKDTSDARLLRNTLLSETDWWAVADRTMTDAEKNYRSLLRFVPQQSGFPTTISWPTKPE